jgi:hypothetical protein
MHKDFGRRRYGVIRGSLTVPSGAYFRALIGIRYSDYSDQ